MVYLVINTLAQLFLYNNQKGVVKLFYVSLNLYASNPIHVRGVSKSWQLVFSPFAHIPDKNYWMEIYFVLPKPKVGLVNFRYEKSPTLEQR